MRAGDFDVRGRFSLCVTFYSVLAALLLCVYTHTEQASREYNNNNNNNKIEYTILARTLYRDDVIKKRGGPHMHAPGEDTEQPLE